VNSGSNLYFSRMPSPLLAKRSNAYQLADMTCNGGHGLSIGSVGGRSNNVVSNVTFIDSSISNSQNGVRIKTVYNATGSVSDVRSVGALPADRRLDESTRRSRTQISG
jgi:hypothetical protein